MDSTNKRTWILAASALGLSVVAGYLLHRHLAPADAQDTYTLEQVERMIPDPRLITVFIADPQRPKRPLWEYCGRSEAHWRQLIEKCRQYLQSKDAYGVLDLDALPKDGKAYPMRVLKKLLMFIKTQANELSVGQIQRERGLAAHLKKKLEGQPFKTYEEFAKLIKKEDVDYILEEILDMFALEVKGKAYDYLILQECGMSHESLIQSFEDQQVLQDVQELEMEC